MPGSLLTGRGRVVRSTSDFVYNSVRQAIVTHEFTAGQRLVEAKTARDLNVSITPVREAFAKLVSQGLLTAFPYKGTYVTVISKEYVEDVEFLRKHLEVMAAERGFAHLTDTDVAFCEGLFQKSDAAFDEGDLYELIRCDVRFHEHMFLISGSGLLMEMWNVIKYRIENIQSYTKPVMNTRVSIRHHAMLEAMRNRGQDSYVKGLLDHLNSNTRNMFFPDEKDIRYD